VERATFEQLSNPFRLELVEKLNEARDGLEKRIRELWRAAASAEEIVLERRDLEELTGGLPDLEARRRWTLPQALFPGRDRRESEAGYFLRIQRWREELGVPEEVFVRIVDRGESAG